VAKANEKVVAPCRAYVSRHVEAGLQQVRHHLEYGDFEVAPEQRRPSRRSDPLER